MKKSIIVLAGLALAISLVAGVATAATTGAGDVDFTVTQTLELTAANVSLGSVSPGTNGPTDKNSVTISSNVDWNVTAYGPDFQDAGATVSLGIENLTMTNALNADNITGVVIASGSAGQSLNPNVPTTLEVPWTSNLGGKALSSTLTYTAVPE